MDAICLNDFDMKQDSYNLCYCCHKKHVLDYENIVKIIDLNYITYIEKSSYQCEISMTQLFTELEIKYEIFIRQNQISVFNNNYASLQGHFWITYEDNNLLIQTESDYLNIFKGKLINSHHITLDKRQLLKKIKEYSVIEIINNETIISEELNNLFSNRGFTLRTITVRPYKQCAYEEVIYVVENLLLTKPAVK
jgi:hypothetical protein